MTPRRKRRLYAAVAVLLGVAVAGWLGLSAFQDNLLFYFSPSEVHAGEVPQDRAIRVGGMVVEGSLSREPGSMKVNFVVTDYAAQVEVEYDGILPDLFREGQGVIAQGRLDAGNRFVASEVLAKHDENYMPPEVADSLKKVHEQANDS